MALTAELKIGSGYGPPSALAFDGAGGGRHVRAWCQDGRDAGDAEVIARVAHVLTQVVEALAWRHVRGLAYGRLTADCVQVDPEGRVALAPEQQPRGPRAIPDDVAAVGRLAADLLSLAEEPPEASRRWIERMTDPEPAQRPSLARGARGLLAPLGGRAPFHPRPLPANVELYGREGLERGLERRLAALSGGAFRLVVLTGPAGVGKAALAGAASRQFEAAGGLVLRGRARPRDRRAFCAVAEAVDALTMALGRRHGGARSSTEAFRATAAGARRREDFFEEVVRLLRRAAQDGAGVAVVVQDLQWADDDSLALLDHVVAAAPERVAVVATLTDDHGRCAAGEWLDERAEADRLDVAPLDDADTRRVLERAAQDSAGDGAPPELDPVDVDAALAHAGGLPALAELAGRELARGGAHRRRHTLLEGVGGDVRALAEADRRVLALLLAADDWLRTVDVARLLELPMTVVEAASEVLRKAGLVHCGGGLGVNATLSLAHETVRLSVRQGLTDDERAQAHAALAADLRGDSMARPERVVRHLAGAGKAEAAARVARVAALSAERLGAHGLAADMYEIALSHPGAGRVALLQARARALERSGRLVEAADCWEALADLDSPEAPATAAAHAAEALMAAGELVQAQRRLERAGATPKALLRASRPTRLLDPRQADALLYKAGDASLDDGDAHTAVRAWCLLAVHAQLGRAGWLARRRAASLRRQADDLAPPLPWRLLLVAAEVLSEDRPRDSRPRFIEAAAALADSGHPSGPERRLALVLAIEASRRSGDPRLLSEAAAIGRTALPDGPDLELRCDAALAEALALAADHQTDAARARLTAARRGLPESPPTLPTLRLAAAGLLHELGAACPAGSRARLESLLAEARAAHLRPFEGPHGGLLLAIAARLEAAALRAHDPAASPRRLRKLLARARAASVWDGDFGMGPAA